jgi:hypothetical protein
MLRLHLKGLENFKVTNGKVTLEAAVSSQDGKVRLWKDGKEDSPLDSEESVLDGDSVSRQVMGNQRQPFR